MKSIKDKLQELSYPSSTPKKHKDDESPVKHQLERIYTHKKEVKHFPDTRLQQQSSGLEELVGGRWINTPFGDIFRAEYAWDLNELYGKCNLSTIFSIDKPSFSDTFCTPIPPSWESLIFVDTETTGLSGGSGTVAFMIGLGFIKNGLFHVYQYFISRLSHEEGMLELIRDLLNNFHTLVTFNGKIYDIPLLNTRFVMNHLPPLDPETPHADLLHHSRNLWKFSQENCKLTSLERDKLGYIRDEDIPGEMIPGVYFEYMRLNRVDLLAKVFIHNRWDIITMLAILIRILESHERVQAEENPLDDYAKGRLFRNRLDFERSVAHYRFVLKSDISLQRRQKTLLELASIHKKQGMWREALEAWTEACHSQYPFSYEAYVERAIYHEHREKNYETARQIVEEALANIPFRRRTEIESLEYRLSRIIRKLEAGK